MKPDLNLVLAGFGGQGLLFAGKIAAYAGLIDGREISWLPSYGPEMRGGTCNCSVCVSDKAIGSPLVLSPNALIVMNLPSLDKFIGTVAPGGVAVVDSSMIAKKVERTDIKVFYVPATKMANDNEIAGLGNVILLGKLFKELGFCTEEALDAGLLKCVPASKPQMVGFNRKALKLGMEA